MPQFIDSIEYTDTKRNKVTLDGITSVSTVDASTLSVANVTTSINGQAISSIFEDDGTTVRSATKAGAIEQADTRESNKPPNYYHAEAQWGKNFIVEFKDSALIGLSGQSKYCQLITYAKWTDETGGNLTQVAVVDANYFIRTSIDSDSWGEWQKLVKVGEVVGNATDATNATNIIPNENGAVNPLGRKADSDVGNFSTALGYNSTASGGSSTAIGSAAQASGASSTALGYNSAASGNYSTALGQDSAVSGGYSTALGYNSAASGTQSIALGVNSAANGYYSTALGNNSTTKGASSIALGYKSSAEGSQSIALGYNSVASGDYSTALGRGSTAESESSTALGQDSAASGASSIALGYKSSAEGTQSIALGVNSAANSNFSIVLGSNSTTKGAASIILGTSSTVNGDDSIALGNGAAAGGDSAHTGSYSIALGNTAQASGTQSIALGFNSGARGQDSVALGHESGASGNFSTALGGYNSVASGESSTALGHASLAGGASSAALGHESHASGAHSTALGCGSTAEGESSTALGCGSTAEGESSTALGCGSQVARIAANTIQLGSSDLSALWCVQPLTKPSDRRDKTDIEDIADALAFLERLNPVTFVNNNREAYISDEDKKGENYRTYGMCEYDRVSHAAGTKKGERRRCGLIAQEVVEAMQSVYGTDNYADIVNDSFHDLAQKPSDVENKYTLAYTSLVPFLIGAVKELNAKIKALESKLVTPSVAGVQED